MSYLDFIDPGNSGGSVIIPELRSFNLSPTIYTCRICSDQFSSQDDLFQHRFESHPFLKPALILRGLESTTPRIIISKSLLSSEISVAHAHVFKINGNIVDQERFISELSEQTQGIIDVSLGNHGVETLYELEFDIADDVELKEVDQNFFTLLGSNILDISRIDSFIDATGSFKTAARYVDGLSNYLYAVLAKDQRGGTHLEQREYKERLNVALDILRLFETPLSIVITAIINFNQNVFNYSESLLLAPKLDQVMKRFTHIMQGKVFEISSIPSHSDPFRIPLDVHTDKLFEWAMLDWGQLYEKRREIEMAIKSPNWVPDDRFKARILLTESCVSNGDFEHAKNQVRGGVVNDAKFGDWAQSIKERSI